MDKGRRSCMAWTSSHVAAKYKFCGLQWCLGYEQHDRGFEYRQVYEIFACANRQAGLWCSRSLLLREYRDTFCGGESAGTRMTPHCLVRRLKMSGTLPLFPLYVLKTCVGKFHRNLRSSTFWDFSQPRLEPLKTGPIGSPETSVTNYQSPLQKIA